MAKQAEHTPTPWAKTSKAVGSDRYIIHDVPLGVEYKVRVVVSGPNSAQDARFVLRAVNSHDELVAALEASQNILFALHESETRPDAKKFLADRMTGNTLAIAKATS
jgi:ATPase subunit of ABC transporter with duplicated ATPase domains